MVKSISDKTLWLILNTAVFLAFCLMGAINGLDIFIQHATPLSALFVFEGILLALTLAGLVACNFTEYKFCIYAVLCLFWGIDGMLSGRGLIGYIVYAVSFLFMWRQHNVSPWAYLIAFLSSLPVPVAIILLAYDGDALPKLLMQVIAFTLLCALSYFLIRPAIAKKKIMVHETIDCSGLGLSDREIRILNSALKAVKYTAIAADERISESYVKKCMKSICRKMQVADRTELLATYGGYSIRDDESDPIPYPQASMPGR